MADPVNTIVDHIPLSYGAYWIEQVNDALYCGGDKILKIDPKTKQTRILADSNGAGGLTLVDFHRIWDLPSDLVGAGAPDRRIYVPLPDNGIAEIAPPLNDQLRSFEVGSAADDYTALCMVGAHNAKHLYFHSWYDFGIGVVNLNRPDPNMIAWIPLHGPAWDLVMSPDDRFIYAAHEVDDFISVVDTWQSPATVKKYPVVNSPFGLAMSADGKRLFVAQSGLENHPTSHGTGTLSVLDPATMQGVWIYTDRGSVGVRLNAAETRAYVTNFDANTVSVVDISGTTPRVVDTIGGFVKPGKMCFSADEKRLYVSQYRDPSDGPPAGIAVVAI